MVRQNELLPHSAKEERLIYRMAEECYKICLEKIPPAPLADPPRGMDCYSGTAGLIIKKKLTSAQ